MKQRNMFIAKADKISSVELKLNSPTLILNIEGRLIDVFFCDIYASPDETWPKKLRNKIRIIETAWRSNRVGETVIFRNCEIDDHQKTVFWGGENQPGYQLLEHLKTLNAR